MKSGSWENACPTPIAPAFNRLAELKIPMLLIVGAHDNALYAGCGGLYARESAVCPKSNHRRCAHLPNMDQPQEFQGIVNDFLESLPS